ncbi:MAG: 16S rRNA (adenine(1518)-N(6)/adenine(1519)-N(6))-dimethyltransferase RsmA [Lactobacillales bacterium]|jgi:16S rRNA (adenine1518-N6/adenine1519-N6)-dimethyltransferase|nr:16S rRNA (adenine(1518)-N(6)/adenine(1519)-N(6))-dimethyltransferase RsmA [Lactobacillales bacterium]
MNKQEVESFGRTRKLMQKYQIQPKKSLGQNFLTDANLLQKIVEVADIDKKTNVLEIGPGMGALTKYLARLSHRVLALEIDEEMLAVLEESLIDCPNVLIVNQDVLKVNLKKIVSEVFNEDLPLKVVANLPYYITTPILIHLLESDLIIEKIVVMIQKEVSERISANPSTKAYGSLSIAVQYFMEAKIELMVPKTVFVPQPNVDSAILSLTRRDKPVVDVVDEHAFFRLTRASFAMRRKTLWNNLTHAYGKDDQTTNWLLRAFEQAGIDPKRRGDSLFLQEFADLSNAMEEHKK